MVTTNQYRKSTKETSNDSPKTGRRQMTVRKPAEEKGNSIAGGTVYQYRTTVVELARSIPMVTETNGKKHPVTGVYDLVPIAPSGNNWELDRTNIATVAGELSIIYTGRRPHPGLEQDWPYCIACESYHPPGGYELCLPKPQSLHLPISLPKPQSLVIVSACPLPAPFSLAYGEAR